jgi:glycerol-3-phosphate acyltransferase PlsY
MEACFAVAIGYFVGSVPFAFLLARRRGIDLRLVGSGNIGAANVLRSSGVRIAVLAMCLDAIKGSVAVLVAQSVTVGLSAPVAAGVASVIGHIYPVWLRFRGGKGVATAAGVFAVLTPMALGVASVVFLVTVWVTRYISLGSMAGAITLTIVAAAGHGPSIEPIAAAVTTAIILHRHRANLARVLAGTERRVGQRLYRS